MAGGYRPAQPASVPNAVWDLITDCWHQDPLCRPPMSAVEQRLRELRGSNYEAVQLQPQQQDRSTRSGTASSRALTGGGASTGTGTLSKKNSRQSVGFPGGAGEGGAEGGVGGGKAELGCGCVIC